MGKDEDGPNMVLGKEVDGREQDMEHVLLTSGTGHISPSLIACPPLLSVQGPLGG